MKGTHRRVFRAEEARAGLALLIAAEEEGLLKDAAIAARWREIHQRVHGDDPVLRNRLAILDLRRDVATAPGNERHWLRDRWAGIDRSER